MTAPLCHVPVHVPPIPASTAAGVRSSNAYDRPPRGIVTFKALATLVASLVLTSALSLSAPSASFSMTPSNPAVGVAVQFTDTSGGAPTSWSWDFGDGQSSASQSPTHVYAAPGSYVVSLTAENSSGSSAATLDVVVSDEQSLRLLGAAPAGPHPFEVRLLAGLPGKPQTAAGRAIPQNDKFGYFTIPDLVPVPPTEPLVPEVFVKMLDARPIGQNFWVFWGGLTNLDYTLTVQEVATGAVKTYHNPATGGPSCLGADTSGFQSAATPTPPAPTPTPTASPTPTPTVSPTPTPTVSPGTPIPSTFFGMTTVDPTDFPAVTIGALGHPPTLAWGWIERSKGVYTWTSFDRYVADAQSHRIPLMITFGDTPGWATADQSSCQVNFGLTLCTAPPIDIQDWKDFINAVATHYKGQIKYYELWNEANGRTFWSGTIADLVNLARNAYPIIKSIDPDAMVLTPSVTGPVGNAVANSASTWMAQYLQAGGSQYADGGTFHGYLGRTGVSPYPMPEQDTTAGCVNPGDCYGSIVTRVQTMRSVFDDNGLLGKPMFQTEGSWGNNNVTDPDTQVAWLARWYVLQASSFGSLSAAYWYTWGVGQDGNQPWGGIETVSRTPTAAGIAYSQLYNWLVGATVTSPCAATAGSTWTCTLTRPGGYQALVIWNTATAIPYTPAAQYTQYRDLAGNTFPVSGPLVIGPKPTLLEGMTAAAAPASFP